MVFISVLIGLRRVGCSAQRSSPKSPRVSICTSPGSRVHPTVGPREIGCARDTWIAAAGTPTATAAHPQAPRWPPTCRECRRTGPLPPSAAAGHGLNAQPRPTLPRRWPWQVCCPPCQRGLGCLIVMAHSCSPPHLFPFACNYVSAHPNVIPDGCQPSEDLLPEIQLFPAGFKLPRQASVNLAKSSKTPTPHRVMTLFTCKAFGSALRAEIGGVPADWEVP